MSPPQQRAGDILIKFSLDHFFNNTYHKKYWHNLPNSALTYSMTYPITYFCHDGLFDSILFCIAASNWDKMQFFKIIDWFFSRCSNNKYKKLAIEYNISTSMFDEKIALALGTVIKIGLFAEPFGDSSDADHLNKFNSKSCNFDYNNYFKDLTKVKYILKYMVDSNDREQKSRKKLPQKNTNTPINANSRGLKPNYCHKLFVLSIPHGQYINNVQTNDTIWLIFWETYKQFVLTLLFGNHKNVGVMNDNDHNERNIVISLLEKSLRTEDKRIVNSYCIKYNYDYIENFKQCLGYVRKLFMQSMDFGSQAHKGYYHVMNWDFRTRQHSLLTNVNNVGYYRRPNSWALQLLDVICFALEDTDFRR